MKYWLLPLCLLTTALLLMSSCEKENLQVLTTVEEEIQVDTIICEISANVFLSSDSLTLAVSITGGVSPYSYFWSEGSATNTITPTNDGTYTVTVTDDEGCFTTADYEYMATDTCADFTVQAVYIDSSGLNYLQLDISGGLAPFNYNWSEGSHTSEIGPIGNGTFGVTVTDDRGCSAEDEITI